MYGTLLAQKNKIAKHLAKQKQTHLKLSKARFLIKVIFKPER